MLVVYILVLFNSLAISYSFLFYFSSLPSFPPPHPIPPLSLSLPFPPLSSLPLLFPSSLSSSPSPYLIPLLPLSLPFPLTLFSSCPRLNLQHGLLPILFLSTPIYPPRPSNPIATLILIPEHKSSATNQHLYTKWRHYDQYKFSATAANSVQHTESHMATENCNSNPPITEQRSCDISRKWQF